MNRVFDWWEAPKAEYAVIGDPVSHSLSPAMHCAALRAMGLEESYVALHVPRGQIRQALGYLAGHSYKGLNVTVPHKLEVLECLKSVDEFSRRVGACNTIRLQTWEGINTDGPGFLDTLEGIRPQLKRVLVIGAGGSARSVLAALASLELELAVFNRTQSRAIEMLEFLRIQAHLQTALDPRGYDLVVNTTSASLAGESLRVPWEDIQKTAIVYDLMYSAEPTPFLIEAQAAGLKTIDGKELLLAQGARSFEWWTGLPAPREVMRRAIQ